MLLLLCKIHYQILPNNQITHALAHNLAFHGTAKHLDLQCYFGPKSVKSQVAKLDCCPSQDLLSCFQSKTGSMLDGYSWILTALDLSYLYSLIIPL